MAAEHPVPRRTPQRRMSPTECRAWVSSHREGRLGYLSGRGPRSVVVSYALAGDLIVMRLPDYHDAVHYAPGAEVSLEVDGDQEVEIRGTAVREDDRPDPGLPLDETWPPGVATSLLRIPLTSVHGSA